MNNPYDKVRFETEYNNWASGFGSQEVEDCPYGDETDELYKVWMKGYRANKNRVHRKVPTLPVNPNAPVQVPVVQTAHTIPLSVPPGGYPTLADIPTDALFQEVARRLKTGQELLDRVKQLLG